MAALNLHATETFNLSALRQILGGPGPCITVVLPTYKPGEPAGSPATILRTAIREAGQKLAEFLPSEAVAALAGPLEDAARDPELAAGARWGRVVFRSPGVFEQFLLTRPAAASTTIAGSFAIRPLMDEFSGPETFFLLNVSKEDVAVFRCRAGQADRVALPRGLPETLKEALDLEPPDHDLQNRSVVHGSTGTMGGIRFGTGSERETRHTHLADFYKLVDRGLKELAGERRIPLIVAGVEEDAAMFRRVSTYPHGVLPEGITGSPGAAGPHEGTLEKAYSILRADFAGQQAASLNTDKERAAKAFSTDPDLLLRAAFEGRVGKLYINQHARRIGIFDRANYNSWGDEDLLNLAAVQTILRGGEACELPAANMPAELSGEKAAVAGTLRY